MYLISIFLLAIASNVDNLAIGIAYGVKKIKIGKLSNLVISLVTGIGTYISISVGKTISNYLAGSLSNLIGSFVLIAIGLWVIWETRQQEQKRNRNRFRLREQKRVSVAAVTSRTISDSSFEQFYEEVSYESFIEEPEKADKDKSGYIDVKESIALALGLTINNLVIGVGAGICGFQVALTSFLSFILSLFAITGGYFLGDRFKIKMSGIWTGILSGCLLIGLGVYEYFIS